MSLAPGTRCVFVIGALSSLLEPSDCLEAHRTQDFPLAEDQARILLLTLLALGLLILLGCLGCLCCYCRTWLASTPDGLDIYAPRTQSIVWPALPQETARIREVTFLPGCLCRSCRLGRISLYIENCGVTPQCV